jgi:hypothetical protein
MSYYYKYNFVSPEPIYSLVKEELKSYFDTGAVDDLVFPTYLDKCLRKLGRATYQINQIVLDVLDFEARLPDNFFAVREAWMCAEEPLLPYQTANSFYSQASTATTIQVSPITTDVDCPSSCCGNVGCDGSCMPEIIQTVYKTNAQAARSVTREYLMLPGTINGARHCTLDYGTSVDAWEFNNAPMAVTTNTPGSSSLNSFDIRDNKFVTNVRNAVVQLIFYTTQYDQIGNQMIPDNYRIREYVEAFIKYKIFETLSNQLTDETFEQIQKKLGYYKQLSEEAFIMADIEIKKQDPYAKQRRIKNDLNRFNMYELPNRSYRYGWRRNN